MGRAGPVAEVEFRDENATVWEPQRNPNVAAIGGQSVVFFHKAKLDPELSKAEGRPRYKKIPYIRISQPMDRDNIIVRQVWEDPYGENIMADNVRFKEKWDRFLEDGEDQVQDGTPLENVAFLSREQVEELKHFNIFTVEGLANITDINASKFLGIRSLSRLAKDYLEAATDGSVVTRLHGDLEKEKSRSAQMEKDIADQAEMIRQLREMVEAQQRGREASAADAGARPQDPAPRVEVPELSKVEKTGGFLKPKKV